MSDTELEEIQDATAEVVTQAVPAGENQQDVVSDPEDEEASLPASDANMAFETKKFILLALLEKASAVLPNRDVMAVLKNFQVEAGFDESGLPLLRVVATDLELSVIAQTSLVKVTQAGDAVFPGKRLLELVKEAEDKTLTVDVKDGVAHIAVDRAKWELHLSDGSKYPDLPDLTEVDLHTVNRASFFDAVNSVKYAAGTETVRPNLMQIDIANGQIRAADGVRFQQAKLEDWPTGLDVHIPINAVDDLARLLRTSGAEVIKMGQSDNHVVWRIDEDTFLANKLNAEFPPVDELLLKPAMSNDMQLSCDREELIKAIKRVRVTADERTSAVVFALDDELLTVRSKDKYGNAAEEPVDVSWSSGSLETAFNHQFLLDMLQGTDVKTCEFFFGKDVKTRKAPVLLKDEQNGRFGVLNQIRIDYLS